MRYRLWVLWVVLPCLALGNQDSSSGQTRPPPELAGLRAEVKTARLTYDPNGTIWVHFSLHNDTNAPIDIPLPQPISVEDGVGLPIEMITGVKDQPLLWVSYQGDTPAPIKPPAPPTRPSEGISSIRLAPHASLGADVDLRTLHRTVRYTGVYKLEWRALEGRIPPATVDARVEPHKEAIIVTDYGKITVTLLYDKAPINIENFLDLARTGYYVGKTFHRIVPGFTIQGGCPVGNGTGVRTDGRLVAAEFNDTPIDIGTVVMARKKDDPNSASCQFFIALARLPELDGKYTVIGTAKDDESLRTLQLIAALATDKSYRPIKPVTIRSINLVDVPESTSTKFETNIAPTTTEP